MISTATRAAVVFTLAALGACKQAKEPTPASELLAKVRTLSAQACACADRACVEPILREWNALTTAIGEGGKVSGGTFTEEQVEGLATEDERLVKCVARFAPADTAPQPGAGSASPATGSGSAAPSTDVAPGSGSALP